MSLNALVRDDELHTQTDAERASERVLRPFHQFARWQAAGALLLLVCAVGALVWAVGLRALHAPDPGRLVDDLRDAGIKT
jgi:hypothetical protein